ncbi:interferon a3-like [Polymixia lowei]
MTQQECPVSFPERFYKEQKNAKVDSRIVFIRDSLKLIMDLYRHGDMSTVTWDTNKFEQFMVTMHRQMDELNNCVSTTSKADRRLTRYYRKLRRTLYKEGSSSVSLELIRKETKRHLQMLDLLMVNTSQRVSAGSQ